MVEPRRALFYAFFYVAYALKRVRVRTRLVAFPDIPDRPYVIWKLAMLAGFKITGRVSGRRGAEEVWYFHSDTDVHPHPEPLALNGRCTDIRKRRVDEVFRAVFGYTTMVDPTRHHGVAVRKSDANARHDGTTIECPIDRPDDGVVYQRLIDTSTADGEVVDLRVGIIGPRVAYALEQYRPTCTRFDPSANTRAIVRLPETLFSADELAKLVRLCEILGLDIGELDVLRDKDGRIYVIDANKTPGFSRRTVLSLQGLRLMWGAARLFSAFAGERQTPMAEESAIVSQGSLDYQNAGRPLE